MLETSAARLEQDLETSGIPFAKATLPMWVFDQTTLRFLAVNQAAVREYGYSRHQFLAMTILDIRPLEDVQRLLRHALQPHQVSATTIERWRHLTRDGTLMAVELSGHPLVLDRRLAQLITVHQMVKADDGDSCPAAVTAAENEFMKKWTRPPDDPAPDLSKNRSSAAE